MKKLIFSLFLLTLTIQSNALELPLTYNNITLNSNILDIDQEYIYIPDHTNRIIIVFDNEGNYQKDIVLHKQINGRLNYFKKVKDGFLVFSNYSLLLINNNGKIIGQRDYPIGCTPSFIGLFNNYITMLLPKVFNKEENTEILDLNKLTPLGTLQKQDKTPITISKNGVLPIFLIYENKKFYYFGNNEDIFWVDYESSTLLITNKDYKQIKTIKDKNGSNGYKSYVFWDNNIYSIIKDENNLNIYNISGDF